MLKFLKRLFVGLSVGGTDFDPLSFHMGFVVDKLGQGKIFIFRNTSTDHCQNHSILTYFIHVPLILKNVVIEGAVIAAMLSLSLCHHPTDISSHFLGTTVHQVLSSRDTTIFHNVSRIYKIMALWTIAKINWINYWTP